MLSNIGRKSGFYSLFRLRSAFLCHRFRVLLSSCDKCPVVNEKETESVLTSNSLPSFAQNNNVKGRSQCGGSENYAHKHIRMYIYVWHSASCTSRCLHPKQPVCPSQATYGREEASSCNQSETFQAMSMREDVWTEIMSDMGKTNCKEIITVSKESY